jgi:ribosomal protein S25
VSRRVITISRKKWGKSAAKTERIVRDAIPKTDTLSGIDEYLQKAKSVTSFDLANRFNIRISIARNILREKEAEGVVVPYIREGGFVVYTTPAELEKREEGVPIMVADTLEEIASSVPKQTIITEEMDEALIAAGTPGAVKPSKLARKRREVGEKKERKDERPEVIVEPLEPQPVPEDAPVKKQKKAPAKKKPAKKTPAKKKAEKKAAPKKKAPTKKKAEEKPPTKKKSPAKKTEKKEEPKKKAAAKKAPAKKKSAEKKPAKKTSTKKKADEKKPAKKTETKKKADEKKPAKKTSTKKKK